MWQIILPYPQTSVHLSGVPVTAATLHGMGGRKSVPTAFHALARQSQIEQRQGRISCQQGHRIVPIVSIGTVLSTSKHSDGRITK